MYTVVWSSRVTGLVLIYLSTDDKEWRVKSWEEIASFTSRGKGLLYSGVPKLTPFDVRLLLEGHHSVWR